MEFYLHNKDDRKSSTLVNLGTTFKIDDTNYLVYYNKQVEKSVIDIYIGKISYGDQCLVINKIDEDKQTKFLNIIKSILANDNPETEFGDYDNIIDTATIVLETVQKIQIPTASLENLKKYHKNINDVSEDKAVSENTLKIENVSTDEKVVENNTTNIDQKKDTTVASENKVETVTSTTVNNQTVSNSLSFDDKLSSLNEALNEKKEKEEKKANKKKKAISTPVLVLLIIAVIGSAILYFVGNGLE